MADEWGGPQRAAKIHGLVDSASIVPSDYGADRIRLDLVDVAQTQEDDSVEEHETRTLFLPTQGKPAVIFAASVRKVAGLSPKSKDLLSAIEGHVVDMAVDYQDFTTKDGTTATMTIYRVTSIEGGGKVASEQDFVSYLMGKTPADAAKGRGAFTGTPYAAALISKSKTLELVGGKVALANGRYTLAG